MLQSQNLSAYPFHNNHGLFEIVKIMSSNDLSAGQILSWAIDVCKST